MNVSVVFCKDTITISFCLQTVDIMGDNTVNVSLIMALKYLNAVSWSRSNAQSNQELSIDISDMITSRNCVKEF